MEKQSVEKKILKNFSESRMEKRSIGKTFSESQIEKQSVEKKNTQKLFGVPEERQRAKDPRSHETQ